MHSTRMVSTSRISPDELHALAGTPIPELKRRLRVQLEDGSAAELRDNYASQVHRLVNASGTVDTSWLRVDADGAYFVTREGRRLNVLKATSSRDSVGGRASSFPGETLHIVLDQSGSMQSMNDAAYEGAKELVRSLPPDASVVFTTFNDNVRVGTRRSRDETLARLNGSRLASGTTRLYDAVVNVCVASESDPSENLTVVVVTDGQDTSSRRCASDAKEHVISLQNKPNHRILFLGSNQDAVFSASQLGISAGQALTYGSEERHVRAAFRCATENQAAHRTLRASSSGREAAFTPMQRSTSSS